MRRSLLEHTAEGQHLLDRGKAEGKAESETAAVRTYLARRFGDAPDLSGVAASLAADGVASAFDANDAASSLDDLRR